MVRQRQTTVDRSTDEQSDQTPHEITGPVATEIVDGVVRVKADDQGRQELITPTRSHRLIPARATPLRQCPTNISLDDTTGRALLFNATGEGSYQFGRSAVVEIAVKWYLVHWRTVYDPDTGEESQAAATVLIDCEGGSCVTFSEVIPDRLEKIVEMYGPGPWDPALKIQVVQVKARKSGRIYHDIRLSLNQEQ